MKLITRRQLIQSVVQRWWNAYSPFTNQTPYPSFVNGKEVLLRPHGEIYEDLLKLDTSTASHEDVSKIIGNSSWTRLSCDECGKEADSIVRLTPERSWEDPSTDLCASCVLKAYRLIHDDDQSSDGLRQSQGNLKV